MTSRPLTRDETIALAAHMRDVHGWTIFDSEADDQTTLQAMHRCALDRNPAEWRDSTCHDADPAVPAPTSPADVRPRDCGRPSRSAQ